MRITKRQLRRIIREERNRLLREEANPFTQYADEFDRSTEFDDAIQGIVQTQDIERLADMDPQFAKEAGDAMMKCKAAIVQAARDAADRLAGA